MPLGPTDWTVIGPGKLQGWLRCRCVCGTERDVRAFTIRSGTSKGCGCKRTAKSRQPAYTRATRIYKDMIRRCTDPRRAYYKNYGGRGITICDRWLASLESFVEDMGLPPSSAHTLDRIDNDGPYCKENCRWSLWIAQCRNRKNSHNLTLNGETKTLTEWALITGIGASTIQWRLSHGWSVEQALSLPPDPNNRIAT